MFHTCFQATSFGVPSFEKWSIANYLKIMIDQPTCSTDVLEQQFCEICNPSKDGARKSLKVLRIVSFGQNFNKMIL